MTVEDFYFFAQILAAPAVVISLIFVGLQVRAQTFVRGQRPVPETNAEGADKND